jgi:hypothetical protein
MFKSDQTSASNTEESQNSFTFMNEGNNEQLYAVILHKRRVIPEEVAQ